MFFRCYTCLATVPPSVQAPCCGAIGCRGFVGFGLGLAFHLDFRCLEVGVVSFLERVLRCPRFFCLYIVSFVMSLVCSVYDIFFSCVCVCTFFTFYFHRGVVDARPCTHAQPAAPGL